MSVPPEEQKKLLRIRYRSACRNRAAIHQFAIAAQTAAHIAHSRQKIPAPNGLGSDAGLRKLGVSFDAKRTRMQPSDVSASCLVKIAHRCASVLFSARCLLAL
jgi:hypothetical protein